MKVAIAIAALLLPVSASAQDQTVHAIARICVSEASFARSNDCPAIVEVLRNRARRLNRSLLAMARSYAPRATGRRMPRSVRQAWVAALTLDGTEPRHWDTYNAERARRGMVPVPWARYRSAWFARIAEVESLLRQPREVCADEPLHWGARYGVDYERPMRLGWIRVDCGTAKNLFWRLPGG